MKALKNLLLERALPKGAALIKFSEGPTWRYPGCCMSDVYVQGGVTPHDDSWIEFVDIHALHDAIADHFLAVSAPMRGVVFRFLRKEMLLTSEEAAMLVGAPVAIIDAWEVGPGFPPNASPEREIRKLYAEFRKNRVRPTPSAPLLHAWRAGIGAVLTEAPE